MSTYFECPACRATLTKVNISRCPSCTTFIEMVWRDPVAKRARETIGCGIAFPGCLVFFLGFPLLISRATPSGIVFLVTGFIAMGIGSSLMKGAERYPVGYREVD